ncbi:MAG: sulfotransferase domain-containing protein [Nitrospinales bacterium]
MSLIKKIGWKILSSRQVKRYTGSLPDFLIIGAMKCGTTSLYHYLIQHPDIYPAYFKEIHFFDNHYHEGFKWYRSRFPTLFYKHYTIQVRRRNFITGEASPYYMFHPHVPKRVHYAIPGVKLIMILRNPVDRAYSHYHHWVREGIETLSFEDSIKAESERLAGEFEKMLEDEYYFSYNYGYYSYLSRGIYVDQIESWTSLFDRKQILILNSEEFYADPQRILSRAFEFLKIPACSLIDFKGKNIGSYPEMPGIIRRDLIDYFAPQNKRLYELLGTKFDWDK